MQALFSTLTLGSFELILLTTIIISEVVQVLADIGLVCLKTIPINSPLKSNNYI